MSQTETGKAVAADERTEAARSFVHTVKAATRRKHTPEEKIRIVLEGFRREVTVSDLCRREGIKPHSYYSWTKEFMEAGQGEAYPRHGARCHQGGGPSAQAGERRAKEPLSNGPNSVVALLERGFRRFTALSWRCHRGRRPLNWPCRGDSPLPTLILDAVRP